MSVRIQARSRQVERSLSKLAAAPLLGAARYIIGMTTKPPTDEARDNLAAILEYTATHYPQAYDGLRSRLRCAPDPLAFRVFYRIRVRRSRSCTSITPHGTTRESPEVRSMENQFGGRENWSGRRGSNPRPRPWQGRHVSISVAFRWLLLTVLAPALTLKSLMFCVFVAVRV
jgi:hypothetical protein